ncbi:acyl-CoA dehydrogenase family protein [Lichenicoccus sp.]|uniref:acyl-CoA dehydrogenase family protein n=1 Tax=Lichenicoccus sp. TaxID=2781899 RepID=UPI003D09BDA9
MPLFLDDDQTMLADTVRPFMAERAPVRHLRALRDAADPTGFSRDLWQSFAEMGFTGVLVGEAHGGLGLGQVEAGIILEEIGRNLAPSPFLSTSVGAAAALASAAAPAQARFLSRIADGTLIAALAFDEASRHRPTRVAMRAQRSGNGFRLTGEKRFVAHGHVADLILVSARTAGADDDADGITLFAVEQGAAGLTATPERLADSSLASHLRLDGVTVDADAVIGEIDAGSSGLACVLGAVRVGAAAELVGVAAGAMRMTVDYLGTRKQFGQTIGSFQALQHRAAHLYAELEVARAAVLKAQQLLDTGDPQATRATHVAKALSGLASTLAVQESVQMHGGIGMTDDYDIGFFMKRARVLGELFGDADHHADQLARLSGY